MHVESLGKLSDLTSVLEALPGKLDINSPSFLYILGYLDYILDTFDYHI